MDCRIYRVRRCIYIGKDVERAAEGAALTNAAGSRPFPKKNKGGLKLGVIGVVVVIVVVILLLALAAVIWAVSGQKILVHAAGLVGNFIS